jgi:Na+/H+ antiporter NhaC
MWISSLAGTKKIIKYYNIYKNILMLLILIIIILLLSIISITISSYSFDVLNEQRQEILTFVGNAIHLDEVNDDLNHFCKKQALILDLISHRKHAGFLEHLGLLIKD